MVKGAVAEFTVSITLARKRTTTGVINLFSPFDNNMDVIDIVEEQLGNEVNFLMNHQFPNTPEKDVASPKKLKLEEIFKKGTKYKIIDGKRIRVYKYLHFGLKYGENGDKSVVEKPDGQEIDIENDDYQHRIFHVFLAYPYDSEAQEGILILESRGSHSIQGPVRTLLKNCLKDINGNHYTVNLAHFVDKTAINSYIEHNRVSKLRLRKLADPTERGEHLHYADQELIFYSPRGDSIAAFLRDVYVNKYIPGKKTSIREIDEFEPDIVKFEVKTENGIRTYTSGRQTEGLIQRILPDGIIGADGMTNKDRFLSFAMSLYEEEHLNLGE